MKRYARKFSESRLIPISSYNEYANTIFSKELEKLKVGTIVWIQDKKSDYQGYYIVELKNNTKKFRTLGTMPQGISYDVLKKAPILKEQLEEDKSLKAIKDLIDTKWSGSNEDQGKAVALLKGLAFSDTDISNKFMKELDKFTSGLKVEKFEEKIIKTKSAQKVLQLLDKDWEYMDAVKKVSKEDKISIEQLEKELDPFI